MFIDQVTITCQGGEGGRGCVAFRREAFVPRGGPNGGDGGDGGHVIIRADEQTNSLANLTSLKQWHAERGRHGEGSLRTGRSGDDLIILVPPGTLVKDTKRDFVLKDLSHDGEEIIVAHGGKGGRGNKKFASATNQVPREYEEGEPGEVREVTLELKLIADVGLIGKPNAGKSTLLSRLSKATPEIANYPFTTKYPNLGLVEVDWSRQFVLADIPGLIEGAHAGVGLGHEFLRHVERTKVFVHLVEPTPMDQTDPLDNYRQIREELRLYDASLAARPEIIAVSKCELPDAQPLADLMSEELDKPVRLISSATGVGLKELKLEILQRLDEL